MKTIIVIATCLLLLFSCKSSTKEKGLQIFREGTEKVNEAQTVIEVDSIYANTYKRFLDYANGPDGEKTLTQEDQQHLINAQTQFYKAAQERIKVLENDTTERGKGCILQIKDEQTRA